MNKEKVLFYLRRLLVDEPDMEKMAKEGVGYERRQQAVEAYNSEEQQAYRIAYDIVNSSNFWGGNFTF